MPSGTNLAAVAALIGDPTRANMLEAVLDGRHLTAGELAATAGITAATASGHLAKLADGGLMVVARQGRHRYYGLASTEIAKMLEGILVVARRPDERSRATPRVPAALVEARSCYDHLAGRLAVSIADALVDREAIELTPEAGEVTERGRALLTSLDLRLDEPTRGRRRFCRPCLDWSERRPHLAGVVGAELLRVSLERNWLRRRRDGRAIDVTPAGRRAYAEHFGVPLRLPNAVA